MKKILMSLALMSFLMVSIFGNVIAETTDDEIKLPEAKKVGFFGNAFGNMKLGLTFNKEKKIYPVARKRWMKK